MQIPVLLVTSPQEPLVESALAFRERRPRTIPMEAADLPGIVLDPTIPAIPIGSMRLEEVTADRFRPRASGAFAVRGFFETDDPEMIPLAVGRSLVFADPLIAPFPTCGGKPVGDVSTVAKNLRFTQLAAKGLDGSNVAIAVMDTGINLAYLATKLGRSPRLDAGNSFTPGGSTTPPGKYPVDHGTMCAFDALMAAPKATLLDFPVLAGSAPGSTVSGRSLATALLGFSQLLISWAVSYATGGVSQYQGLVVSNSWGMYHPSWDFPAAHPGRYCDNPQHPFNVIVAALAAAGADILFAAGNCGADCPDSRCKGRVTETIMGANAHQDVLTIAGCDTNDDRVGYSSQGPSIAGMPQQKPDLAAYTHFIGSEAFGIASPDTGTSTACPVAAGCVAALRTKAAQTTIPPTNLFAQLKSTGRTIGPKSGWNGDLGHGIIDPVATATSLGL
jgi:hypothetical protein